WCSMFESKTSRPRLLEDDFPSESPKPSVYRQHRLMTGALALLLAALGLLLYADRDFWFPSSEEAVVDDSAETGIPGRGSAPAATKAHAVKAPESKTQGSKSPGAKLQAETRVVRPERENVEIDTQGPSITAERTVLPPLQVEVVAGSAHRTLQPGT